LLLATVRLAAQAAQGQPGTAPGAALAEGVLRGMARTRLATATALLLTLLLVVVGAGALAQPKTDGEPRRPEPPAAPEAGRDPGAVVAGTVTDPAGRPVAGARVWLREGMPSPHARSVAADGQGSFRFAAVTPGTVGVAALAPGHSYAGLQRELAAG